MPGAMSRREPPAQRPDRLARLDGGPQRPRLLPAARSPRLGTQALTQPLKQLLYSPRASILGHHGP